MILTRITQKLIKYLTPVLWEFEYLKFTISFSTPLKELNKSKTTIKKLLGMDELSAIVNNHSDKKPYLSIQNTILKSSIQKEVGDARYHPKN